MSWESWLPRLALAATIAWQLVGGNTAGALVAGEGVVVSLLPRLIERLSGIRVPRIVELLFVLGIALQFISESFKLFELFTYWDKIVHPTLIALTALLVAWLLLGYRDRFGKNLPIHVVFALALMVSMAVGAAWEFVEFISDWFGDADLQKSTADSMTDMIANNVGAFVATLIGLWSYQHVESEHKSIGELARWLCAGPTRMLDRGGVLIGGALALAFAGVIGAGVLIDRDPPALAAGLPAGQSVHWSAGLPAPAVALAGDWVPDQRGICRMNLEHPKPGSEKMGVLQLAPGSVYESFVLQAHILEQRPQRVDGTQMDGGLAFGIRDAENFYVLEQSALHDVLRLDRVIHGRRRDVREALARTHGDEWHTVEVRVRGSHVAAVLDGQEFLALDDVPDTAGGVGVWARTAAATCVDAVELQVEGS